MALNNLGLGFLFTAKDMASDVLKKIGGGLDSLDMKASKLKPDLDDIGHAFGIVAAASTAFAVAGTIAIDKATDAAGRFGKGMAEVSTLVDEAQFSSADLEKTVLKMMSTFGGKSEDHIKALYQSISAGANDAVKANNLLTAANKLAIGGVTESTNAVNALTNTLNAYSLSYDKATDVSDAFFVAIRMGKTTATELANTIGRLAPTAASVGVGFDQLLAAVAAVTTKGLKTEEAVTGIKAAFANIIKPTADAAAEAKRLGIAFDANALRSKGLPGLLNEITSSSKFNKDSIAKLFGSVEALNAIMALTSGTGFKDTLDAMAKRAGGTDAAFEKMAGETSQLKAQFEALKEQALVLIGRVFQPLQAAVLRVANFFLTAFNKLPAPIRTAVVALGGIAVAMAGFVGMVAGAVAGIIALKAVILPLVAVVVGLTAVLLPLMALFGAVAAVGALVAYGLKMAWDKNLGGIRDAITGFVDKVKLLWAGLGQLFEDGGFSGKVMEELNRADNKGLKNFAITVFMWVERVKNFFRGLGAGFEAALEKAGPVFEKLATAFERLGAAFGMMSGPNDPAKSAEAFERWGDAGSKVGGTLEKIVEIAAEVITIVVQVATGFVNGMKNVWPVFEKIGEVIAKIMTDFGEMAGSLGMLNTSVNTNQSGWETFGGILASVVGFLGNVIVNGLTLVHYVLMPMVGAIRAGVMVWNAFKSSAMSAFEGITNGVLKMAATVASVLDKIGKAMGKDFGLSKSVAEAQSAADKFFIHKADTGASGVKPGAVTPIQAEPFRPGSTQYNAMTTTLQGPNVTPTPGGTPGGGQGELLAAVTKLATKEHPPATANVFLDTEKIATVVIERSKSQGNRSFSPTPTPG